MKEPFFIRPLTEDEQRQVQAGLHSSDTFILRSNLAGRLAFKERGML